jgi:hypothetical protein
VYVDANDVKVYNTDAREMKGEMTRQTKWQTKLPARARIADPVTVAEAARMRGVSKQSIRDFIRRKRLRFEVVCKDGSLVSVVVVSRAEVEALGRRRELDKAGVRRIKRRLREGDAPADIAADEQVSVQTISHIKTGRIWRDVL